MRVLLAAFLLFLVGCRSQPIDFEHWGLPDLDATTPSTLRERAQLWEDWLFDRHLSPEGLLLYRIPTTSDPEHGDRMDLADQACWGGYLLAGLACHYAEEPSPAVLERTRRVVRGLALLHDATGTSGLLARCLLPARSVAARAHHPEGWRPAVTGPDLWYRSQPSKDQYSGVVLGLTLAHALVDDAAVRAECERLLALMAQNLIAGNFRFRDADGQVPKFCDLRPTLFGIAIGVNAAVASGLLESAAPYLSAEWLERAEPMRRRARRAIRSLHFEILGIRNYNNDAMAAAGMITLAYCGRRESDRCRDAVREFMSAFRGEGNALFVSVAQLYGVTNRDEQRVALRNLLSAPVAVRVVEIPEAQWAGVEERCLLDRKGKPRAARPLPLAVRPATSFVWRSDPFVLDRKIGARGELRLSAVDFYMAYWLGRHSGWVPRMGQNPPVRPGT